MSTTTVNVTHWTISHGLSGYLPMSDDDSIAWQDWSEARDALIADMRDYADTDDDAAWDSLTMVPASDYPTLEDGSPDYGDDAPSMLATVNSMVSDGDVAPFADAEWSGWIEDSDGRTIYFSLSRHDSSECAEWPCEVIDGDEAGR